MRDRERRLLLLLGALLSHGPALAAAPSANLDVSSYEAPPDCPTRAEFERAVRARLSASTGGAAPEFSVRVTVEAGRAFGHLLIRSRNGAVTTRNIEAATCAEAADGLALIVALTLDPAHASAGSAAGSSGTSASESSSAESAASNGSDSPRSGPGTTPGKGETPSNGSTPGNGSTLAGTSASTIDDSNSEATGATPGARGPSSIVRRFDLSTSGLAVWGVVPDGIGAMQLAGRFSVRLGRPWFAARVGARLSAPQTQIGENGDATFKAWVAIVNLCAGSDFAGGSLTGFACAGLEQGLLFASGSDTRNPSSRTRSWTAIGPSLSLDWILLPPLFVEAGGELLFPAVRDRFLIGDEAVYRVPAAGIRLELGMGVRF